MLNLNGKLKEIEIFLEFKKIIMNIGFKNSDSDIQEIYFSNIFSKEEFRKFDNLLEEIIKIKETSFEDIFHKNFYNFILENLKELFELKKFKYQEIDDLIILEDEYWNK